MKDVTVRRWILGGSAAAVMALGTTAAPNPSIAQSRVFSPGTDCSSVPQTQQADCHIDQQQNSSGAPGGVLPVPAGNGTGTNQDGTMGPNGSSGQTNGSTLSTGGGNGGASPPGQSGN
jgi:hypothetical protein